MDTEALSRQIVEVARSLEHETGSQDTMQLVVQMAVETVPYTKDAAITVAQVLTATGGRSTTTICTPDSGSPATA